MSKKQHEKRVWQCPQCHKRFKISTDMKTPTACPSCAAFDEIVEESVPEKKPLEPKKRWRIFPRRKKPPIESSVDQPQDSELIQTNQPPTTFPQCKKCGGPLVSFPMLRYRVIRWIREFIHVTIGLAAFALVPPYGVAVGIIYILIALYIENKLPIKKYWKCQHCGKKI